MNPIIEQIISQERSPYDELPEVVRGMISSREWQFLTDQQKSDLVRDCCEPEA